jgi:hypothetical protein
MLINTVIYDAGDAVADCEPVEGTDIGEGEVVAVDPVTVCCTSEA